MNKNTKKFVGTAILHMLSHKVNIVLSPDDAVLDDAGVMLGGMFTDGRIVCGSGADDEHWLALFVHEYSHFLQCINNPKLWYSTKIKGEDAGTLFSNWLAHKVELTPAQIEQCRAGLVAVELDCDKLAVKLIKQHKLSIDVTDYKKDANAYALFYSFAATHRLWNGYSEALFSDEVLAIVPSTFRPINFYRNSKILPKFYEILLRLTQ